MLLLPALPVAVPGGGGFDYVTVDAARRRVYAAHGGASSLLIVDADTGAVLKQVKVGPMSGLAVNAADGHVFTGDGDDKVVSEVDPVSGTEIHRVAVDGPVDAIAYDADLGRIYADEDDGTRIFVIDAKTFKQIGTVALPGHKPEYLAIDPKTHEVYQNIANLSEVAVVDPKSLTVTRIIATPELTSNHPLQYDPAYGQLLIGGTNGKLSVYSTAGQLLSTIDVPNRVDQCSLNATTHVLACAGGGMLTLIATDATGHASVLAQAVAEKGTHTVGVDAQSGAFWAPYGSRGGDSFIVRFDLKP